MKGQRQLLYEELALAFLFILIIGVLSIGAISYRIFRWLEWKKLIPTAAHVESMPDANALGSKTTSSKSLSKKQIKRLPRKKSVQSQRTESQRTRTLKNATAIQPKSRSENAFMLDSSPESTSVSKEAWDAGSFRSNRPGDSAD